MSTVRFPMAALLAFFALAAFATGHWAALIEDPPLLRLALALALVGVGAAALSRLVSVPRAAARWTLAGTVAIAMLVAALAAGGLELRLLLPANWAELADGVGRGLAGAGSTSWPYGGADHWLRLVVVLGAPATVAVAATLAFWPLRPSGSGAAGVLRGVALVLLLVLYGVAATELVFDAALLRGFVLLALIAAVLWLPHLSLRTGLVCATAVLALGLGAVPVAAALRSDTGWVDYRSWEVFGAGSGISFDWTHSYGPMDWTRDGKLLLSVESDEAHYWKADTLNRFDGLRWVRSARSDPTRVFAELPERQDPRWRERIRFTVRSLESTLLVGAGTTLRAVGQGSIVTTGDGRTRLGEPLEQDAGYTVDAYVPDPTPRELRAATGFLTPALAQYTRVEVPTGRPGGPTEAVEMGLRDGVISGDPGAEQQLLRTPYARSYRLARRLTAGAATTYDAVARVRDHLRGGYEYSETPPERPLPLDAFLFKDKVGYCQQFSGAMALLLRMAGIPARVASGFSPGSRDREKGTFEVSDLDAHSWVEVFFPGIGWATFDPTPSVSPARSQDSSAERPPPAGGAGAINSSPSPQSPLRPDPAAGAAAGRDPVAEDRGDAVWELAAALLVLAAVVAGLLVLVARRRAGAGVEGRLRELEHALAAIGFPVREGDTLLALEQRLEQGGRGGAARYARRLRRHRFGAGEAPVPDAVDRRALRRALGAGGGPRGRLRALRLIPPLPRA